MERTLHGGKTCPTISTRYTTRRLTCTSASNVLVGHHSSISACYGSLLGPWWSNPWLFCLGLVLVGQINLDPASLLLVLDFIAVLDFKLLEIALISLDVKLCIWSVSLPIEKELCVDILGFYRFLEIINQLIGFRYCYVWKLQYYVSTNWL